MQITTTARKFTPVTVSVTFESQREMDAMASMFNATMITDPMSGMGINCTDLRETLVSLGANAGNTSQIIDGVLNSPYMRSTYKIEKKN